MYFANVPSIPTPHPSSRAPSLKTTNPKNFNVSNEFFAKIILTTSFIILINCYLLNSLCNTSCFVPFNIPINTICRKIQHPIDIFVPLNILTAWLSIILLESMKPNELLLFSLNVIKIDLPFINVYHISRSIKKYSFDLSSLAFFASSYSWTGHICCIFILSLSFCLKSKKVPIWFLTLLLLLSNDIERNPGPTHPGNCLHFMTWNLNSLGKENFSRVQMLEAHNSLHNYDIISLCETSLTNETSKLVPKIEGYTYVPSNHPDDVSHGGVGLFYKDSLPATVREDLSFNECLVLELKFSRKKIFFTVLYRSPSFKSKSPAFVDFIQNLKHLHSQISSENPYAMFFAGDFNAHSKLWWSGGDTTPEGQELEDLFTSLNLSQIINEPTNFTPHKNPTCIDLIFTDQPNLVLSSGTRSSLDPKCHHDIIHCRVNYKIPPPPPHERTVWHYDRANSEAIQRSLKAYPWVQQFNLNNDTNWQVKQFTEVVHNVLSNFVPHDIKKIVPRDPRWITKTLKTKLKQKNRLYKNYKKHGYREEDKLRLDKFREECKLDIHVAKQNYLKSLGCKLADNEITQKTYWKIITNCMNKSKAPRIPPLKVDDKFVMNCKDKANLFNDFFSDQCTPNENNSTLPLFTSLTDIFLSNIFFESNEILLHLRNIDPSKSNGPDMITGHMIRLCDDSIVLPLKLIFNNILRTSNFPILWKLANVTPVFKKNDKQLIKNYRPISLLPLLSKVFEKIIFNKLYKHLTDNNLITPNQSGFRPGDSTVNQLLYLVSEIYESFECPDNLEVRAVFLDISKAFDKVWHPGLIFKLKQNGIRGNLLNFFISYLSDRHQRVGINGSYSEYSKIKSGVPQGSVLGPLLFLIYINDLQNNIKSKVKFYADDTMLYSIVKDPTISASDLNHDLDLIQKWAHQWKMEFNPDPLKQATEIIFSCKRNKPNHPPLYFNGSVVTSEPEQKHLGLILTPALSFLKHLYEKITKANKNIGIIKYFSKYLPFKTLNQMYKTFVRTHLDYCDIIYHQAGKISKDGQVLTASMEEVERVQYRGALAVTGTWKGTNRTKLYENLGWESLSDRRKMNRLIQLYKIINKLTPSYLRDKLPPPKHPFQAEPSYTLREYRSKTDRFARTFFPDSVKQWNVVITDFSEMPTLSSFKSHLRALYRPTLKRVFGIYDPEGIKYIFQLRLGLSPLRSHKFRHNFIDTPSDICLCKTGNETTEHFLFQCPFYTSKRFILAEKVVPLLPPHNLAFLQNDTNLYLYGNENLSEDENRSILLETIKFIKASNRFG